MICNTHPMSNHTPVITRKAIAGGKFRYEVDGVVHTAKSGRVYTFASLYISPEDRTEYTWTPSGVREDLIPAGTVMVFLHAREDLALKGSPDARRCGFTKVGHAEIAEVAA